MTVTDPTELGLLAAILSKPDDDTPRLVYADWLEENVGEMPCEQCMGTGSHAMDRYQLVNRYGTYRAEKILEAACCGVCHGTGYTTDTSRRDRAEFCRTAPRDVVLQWAKRVVESGNE